MNRRNFFTWLAGAAATLPFVGRREDAVPKKFVGSGNAVQQTTEVRGWPDRVYRRWYVGGPRDGEYEYATSPAMAHSIPVLTRDHQIKCHRYESNGCVVTHDIAYEGEQWAVFMYKGLE